MELGAQLGACSQMHKMGLVSPKANQHKWVDGTVGLDGFRVDALQAHEGSDGKSGKQKQPGRRCA